MDMSSENRPLYSRVSRMMPGSAPGIFCYKPSHKHNCHSERSEESLTISGFLDAALEKQSEILLPRLRDQDDKFGRFMRWLIAKDLTPRMACAIPSLPFIRKRIALPYRRWRTDPNSPSPSQSYLEKIQDRSQRPFEVLAELLVFDLERSLGDAGEKRTPDFFLLFRFDQSSARSAPDRITGSALSDFPSCTFQSPVWAARAFEIAWRNLSRRVIWRNRKRGKAALSIFKSDSSGPPNSPVCRSRTRKSFKYHPISLKPKTSLEVADFATIPRT